MAVQATTVSRSELLRRLLERHRHEAETLRQQLGDPEEAMAAFVRRHYDADALAESYRALLEGNPWDEDELIDER